MQRCLPCRIDEGFLHASAIAVAEEQERHGKEGEHDPHAELGRSARRGEGHQGNRQLCRQGPGIEAGQIGAGDTDSGGGETTDDEHQQHASRQLKRRHENDHRHGPDHAAGNRSHQGMALPPGEGMVLDTVLAIHEIMLGTVSEHGGMQAQPADYQRGVKAAEQCVNREQRPGKQSEQDQWQATVIGLQPPFIQPLLGGLALALKGMGGIGYVNE